MSIQSIGNQAAAIPLPTETQAPARSPSAVQSNSGQTSASSTPVSTEQLKEAVQSMNDFAAETLNSSLNFTVDNETGKTVVKVMDSETQEVLRQIPSEEMLAIAKAVDKLKGLLVHQKA